MAKKYIFLDVDGTLMDCSGGAYIPDSAITAIRAARQNGHKVFICTGRTPGEISDEMKAIGFDGFVCSAGADIIIDGQAIFQYEICVTELRRLQTLAAANDIGVILQGGEKSYIDERAAGYFEEIEGQRAMDSEFGKMPLCLFTPLQVYLKKPERISKLLYLTRDLACLERAYAQISAEYRLAVHGKAGETVLIGELSASGIVKSTGIQRVLEYFGDKDATVYAYGDSNNDIDMLAAATHGVAMGNALSAVKAVADEVCEPLREDGIYKSFKRNGLLDG